ncbi:MAG: hypothetical protein GX443_03010 [Deltaproteobacteria bacterium]|nr:hypothetical protein [Deltaproteobacteria bacterium]
MRPAVLIETQCDFDSLMEGLAHAPQIAVDTESNSFFAYFERVCLIQISTEEEDYVIDPFSLRDLSAFCRILHAEHIQKVFHAASNDLIGIKRDFHCCTRNLFDTAVACKLLGHRKLGLAHVLAEHFGVTLDKKWQRCDWGKRPLKQEQIDYARLDTHYLIPLRHRLNQALMDHGLQEQARGIFLKICTQEVQTKVFQPNGFNHLKGAQNLDPLARRLLKDLYRYREREAKRRNRAPFRVLSNETLVRLAQNPPNSLEELNRVKGLPKSYHRSHMAQGLLQIIRRAPAKSEEMEA